MTELSSEMLNGLVAFVIAVIVVRYIYLNVSIMFAMRIVNKNPNEANAQRVFKLLNAKFGVKINNHPKDWGEYRDMFYKINGSSQIPTELKEKIKARLIKKGLYINNIKIINNYKGGNGNAW